MISWKTRSQFGCLPVTYQLTAPWQRILQTLVVSGTYTTASTTAHSLAMAAESLVCVWNDRLLVNHGLRKLQSKKGINNPSRFQRENLQCIGFVQRMALGYVSGTIFNPFFLTFSRKVKEMFLPLAASGFSQILWWQPNFGWFGRTRWRCHV